MNANVIPYTLKSDEITLPGRLGLDWGVSLLDPPNSKTNEATGPTHVDVVLISSINITTHYSH